MLDDSKKIKLFVSYSHDDTSYFKVFIDSLKRVARNTEHFEWSIWDDRDIYVGTFWDNEIQKNIKDCDVALLLVSVGFMASKYIKEKEFNEFTQRYANKGILIVPIAFKPSDFNRWEDLGKLQFFKPSGSSYDKPAIEDFTYSDLIKFRDTDGLPIPNPNSDRYILDLVKNVESSYLGLLKEKEKMQIGAETAHSISDLNKLSDYPKPSSLFTGRRTELEEFENKFRSFRVFAIEGLGGTGKTQFAAKCIEEIISDKSKIVWLNGSAQSNFDVFLEGAGYGDVLKGDKKTDLALYSGLKDLLERDQKVIFWDNYNDYEDPAFSKFLSFAYQYLRNSTIVLLTKVDPSIQGITSLPIIRLEGLNDDAIDFAKKLKGTNAKYVSVSDTDLKTICKGVDGHPLAIEFSMWLMGYGKPVEDILVHMPELSSIRKVEEFSRRLFLDIFNHSQTSDEERQCLLKCSVFRERMSEDEIRFLYDSENIFYLLTGLIDKLLISSKQGFYEMHPLVRSFSYEKLQDKETIHRKAADYFISQRRESLNASLEEKIFYHLSGAQQWDLVAQFLVDFGRAFIQQGQLGLMNDLLNKLSVHKIFRPVFEIFSGDIAEIKGEWDKSIIHFKNAGENHEDIGVKAEGMVKHGEILYRKGDTNKALLLFEAAFEFSDEHHLYKEVARALNGIGIAYDVFGEFDKANAKYHEALEIRRRIDDKEGIANCLTNIGVVYLHKNKFNEALRNAEESLKIHKEIGNKVGIANALSNIGSIYSEKQKENIALEYYAESLKMREAVGDKSGIASCLNNIGSVYQTEEKLDEALEKFEQSLKILEEIGDIKGRANILNNIATVLSSRNKLEDALKMYQESLELFQEMGDKLAMAINYGNIASIYDKRGNDLAKTLFFAFNAVGLKNQMGVDSNKINNWIIKRRDKMDLAKFRVVARQAFDKLSKEIQSYISMKEFLKEPVLAEFKLGRNEACSCGSGKKYKQCHGKN